MYFIVLSIYIPNSNAYYDVFYCTFDDLVDYVICQNILEYSIAIGTYTYLNKSRISQQFLANELILIKLQRMASFSF